MSFSTVLTVSSPSPDGRYRTPAAVRQTENRTFGVKSPEIRLRDRTGDGASTFRLRIYPRAPKRI